MRRAQAVGALFDLDGQPWLDPALRQALLFALALCSDLDEFWTRLDQPVDQHPDPLADDREAAQVLRRWGWPYQPPLSERGRLYACRIAAGLSQWVAYPAGDVTTRLALLGLLGYLHPRLAFLGIALGVERRPRALRSLRLELEVRLMREVHPNQDAHQDLFPWRTAEILSGTPGNLRTIWRLSARDQWVRWVGWAQSSPGDLRELFRIRRHPLGLLFLLSLALTQLFALSLATRALGLGDLGVPWAPTAISAWLLLGALAGFWVARFEDQDIGNTAAWVALGTAVPTLVVAESAARLTRIDWTTLSFAVFTGISFALFIATPAGNLTHLLLGLVTISALLLGLQAIETPTHPALPSAGTARLVRFLHQFRKD